MQNKNEKAWIIAVDMGYGHQRTAYPLLYLAPNHEVVNANNYEGILKKDRRIWKLMRSFYETISDLKRIPFIGNSLFSLYDQFQKISGFYPKILFSNSNFQLKVIYWLMKKGWGKDLIDKLSENPLPIISTFYITAFMAEYFNYPGEIYCVICDADVSRTWAPLNPEKSRIKYFSPNSRVYERLQLYGIKKENITRTGYPLPIENIGSQKNLELIKNDLRNRLVNLDPKGKYRRQYMPLIETHLGSLPEKSDHPFTIMFSIGGAGAQKEIVAKFLKSLSQKIIDKEIKVVLVVGAKKKVKKFFEFNLKKFGLENAGVEIIFSENIQNYFSLFNKKLHEIDVLWTKPSELSFYAGLGLPIIIAPSIGSQEDFNRSWLLSLGPGILQENPNYAEQWIFDYLKIGFFAEAAMQGFIEVRKMGTYNIERIISKKDLIIE